MNYETAVKNIRFELERYLKESGLKSLVIGISGGIDSTLCAALAKPVCDELGVKLIGRSINIYTNKMDERNRAKEVGNYFCDDFKEVDLNGMFEYMRGVDADSALGDKDSSEYKIRMGNIKARMRMIYLYNLASKHNGMVLSTDNYTELNLGFWTLHGDVGDYGMIQSLWKTEVYDMTEWIMKNENGFTSVDFGKILNESITCNATDGLGITNTDLEQILPDFVGDSRTGYEKVDTILSVHMIMIKTDDKSRNNYIEKNKDCPILQRHLRTNFKRNNPTNIDRFIITEGK